MRIFQTALRSAAFIGCAGLVACSFSSTTYYSDSEGRFSEQIIESIEPQATSNTWLKKQLGNPLWVDQAANDVNIYTWPLTREDYKRKELFFVLRYRNVVEESEYLHVVLQHNVVVKHWLDNHAQVDVERVTYTLGLNRAAAPGEQLRTEPMAELKAVKAEQPSDGASEAEAPVMTPQTVEPQMAMQDEETSVDEQSETLATPAQASHIQVEPSLREADAAPTAKASTNLYGI